MNCDLAFELLTDPSERNSEGLRRHLDACPRCRQMQEILEPALSLFDAPHGDVAFQSSDLPFGEQRESSPQLLTPEAVCIANRTAAAMRGSGAGRKRLSLTSMLRHAAVVVIGGLVAFSLFPIGADRSSTATVQADCAWEQIQIDARPAAANSHEVVLSCVACHLESGEALTVEKAAACSWLRTRRVEAPAETDSHAVVLSCLSCHLEGSKKSKATDALSVQLAPTIRFADATPVGQIAAANSPAAKRWLVRTATMLPALRISARQTSQRFEPICMIDRAASRLPSFPS